MSGDEEKELAAIATRYAARAGKAGLYDPLLPVSIAFRHEREKALAAILRDLLGSRALGEIRILEIGCGNGRNLADLVLWGADPEKLVGNELLPERLEAARRILPPGVRLLPGNAAALDLPDAGFDIILQSTVFSSILDPGLRIALARNMWRMLAPGGAVIWYDFTVNNPANPDVAGIPVREIRRLFPEARYSGRRLTLAPPIARRVPGVLHALLNAFPFLRTHVMARLGKESE